MKILCDFHHGELYESLQKVFEDRLGGTMYRPIGKEWYDEGYWNIGTDPQVIEQFLGRYFATETENGFWLEDGGGTDGQDYYRNVINVFERGPHNRVSLERAKNTEWDLIITTMLGHFVPMEKFRKTYCPKTKHIFQAGNMLPFMPEGVQNFMNSTASDSTGIPNVVDYYQEFDTKPLFWQEPINDRKALYTFLIMNQGHRGKEFMELEKMMPDWIFREYGSHNREGNIHKYVMQCNTMRDMAFLWHVKLHGDGYGYSLHRALYAGKPAIINYRTVYKDHRLAKWGFFEEGKTFIDYDGKSLNELKEDILRMYDNWEAHSRYTYDRMREFVNFDNEFDKIKKFLERLV